MFWNGSAFHQDTVTARMENVSCTGYLHSGCKPEQWELQQAPTTTELSRQGRARMETGYFSKELLLGANLVGRASGIEFSHLAYLIPPLH